MDRSLLVADESGPLTPELASAPAESPSPAQSVAFLSAASAVLASSLDYATTLRNVARLVVPQFADWCAIDLVDEAAGIERVTVMHTDPAKVELAHELRRRYPYDPNSDQGIGRVFRTGQAILRPSVTDEELAAAARSPEHLRMLQELGIRGLMIVPLLARGHVLGAITLVSEQPGRFGRTDLALVEDLANRCALAVDNARLYRDACRSLELREEALRHHRQMEEHLSTLVEASAKLTGSLEPQTVLASILALSQRMIAADAYAIWRMDAATGAWRTVIDAGLSPDYPRATPATDGYRGVTLKEPLILSDVTQSDTVSSRQNAYVGEGIRSMLVVPLRMFEATTATLVFYYRAPRTFPEMVVRVATALGNLASAAIHTADLYARQTQLRLDAEEAEQRYRFIVENTSDAVWRFDLTRPMPVGLPEEEQIAWGYQHVVLARCNDGMARIYGYERADQMTGLPLAEILPRSDLINVGFLRRFIRSGYRLVDDEARTTAQDGSDRYVVCNFIGLERDGLLHAVFGTSRDITERKRAEQALRDSEAFKQRMIESSRDCIKVLDLEARLLWMSPGGQEALEIRDMNSVLNAHWISYWQGEDRAAAEAAVRAAQEGKTGRFVGFCPTQAGKPKWWDVVVTPIPGEDGRPERLLAVSRDVTELIEADRRLQQLNATLEQRVAERTAEVAEQNAQLQTLAMKLTTAEHQERRRIAQTLHDHFQQILVAAKLGLEQLRNVRDPNQAAAFVGQVEGLLVEAIRASRTLAVELCPPVLYERGLISALEWLVRHVQEQQGLAVTLRASAVIEPSSDDVRAFLFQSVRELLLNVIKHGGTDSATITVSSADGRNLEIVVEDRGRGCDGRALLERGATSATFGLFSIRQRIRLLGGSCEIGAAPGQGCRVRLSVPLSSRPMTPPAPQTATGSPMIEQPATPAAASRIRVLLVDDHRIVRAGLAGLLRVHADIEIVGEASDGETALHMARELQPDVVSMDITMPDMSGIEATRRLTAELPRVRVIALSMHENADVTQSILDAGACMYLPKDGPCEALLAAIREHGRNRRS